MNFGYLNDKFKIAKLYEQENYEHHNFRYKIPARNVEQKNKLTAIILFDVNM